MKRMVIAASAAVAFVSGCELSTFEASDGGTPLGVDQGMAQVVDAPGATTTPTGRRP